MSDLNKAKALLAAGGYTCVLCRGDEIHTATARGVKPLVDWLDSGLDLRGFSAADKVVGRATAFLYVLLGVREVHALVMSAPAKEALEAGCIAALRWRASSTAGATAPVPSRKRCWASRTPRRL